MIPPGWKPVPLEPDLDQVERTLHDMGAPNPKESKQWLREFYRLMISYAPAAPKSEREVAIAEGQNLPGAEGAMLRLLAVCDFEAVRGWINGELARGTMPDERFEVIAAVAANILAVTALSVRENRGALTDLIGRASARARKQLEAALKAGGTPSSAKLRLIVGEP